MQVEEERLRHPVAQGLPYTTDEPEVCGMPAMPSVISVHSVHLTLLDWVNCCLFYHGRQCLQEFSLYSLVLSTITFAVIGYSGLSHNFQSVTVSELLLRKTRFPFQLSEVTSGNVCCSSFL
jgi:hypothetical protein